LLRPAETVPSHWLSLALRHRLLLNFEGEAEGIDPDEIISDILERTGETD